MMNLSMKIWIRYIALSAILVLATPVFAADYSIRPFLWHETVQPRDIITKDIVITNDSGRLLRLYATVNEISVDSEGEIKEFVPPIETDRTTNVTSWIEITRGRIEVQAGETVTIPTTLRINPSAQHGEYHAYIGFFDTNKRYLAEEAALRGDAPGLPVKITISDTVVTDLLIDRFHIPRFVFSDKQKLFSVDLVNNGEETEIPTGEIIFYSNRGEEVASVDFNSEKKAVASSETTNYEGVLPLTNNAGRYRATLNVEYGRNNNESVFATTDFFVIPWKLLLAILLSITVFSIFVTFLLRRAWEDHMIIEHAEVDLLVHDKTGQRSQTKDHDITISKN